MILNLLKNLTCALFILTIIITSLISCNNDISNYEKFYSTSWLCHQKDNYEKFKIIIEKIKYVNKPSKNGSTALHSAVNSSCINNIKLLLDNGADPNKKDAIGNTPLHYAHKAEVIDLLLSKGASANIKNNENITPLENELIMCNYICARILIENNYKFTIDPAARQKILH